MTGGGRRVAMLWALLVVVVLVGTWLVLWEDGEASSADVVRDGRGGAVSASLPEPPDNATPPVTTLNPGGPSGFADGPTAPSADPGPLPEGPEGWLLIRVRWSDGQPASGIHLRLIAWMRPNPTTRNRLGVTDADGECRFERVRAGAVVVYSDRSGSVRVTVEAGKESVGEIVLADGHRVTGTVRKPNGSVAAGAGVWLSSYGNRSHGHVVTTTDASGRFEIRDVGEHRHIGARLAPYSPSELKRLPGRETDVELALGMPGFGFTGVVLDAHGQPAADATVQATSAAPRRSAVAAPGDVTRTDRDGRFSLPGQPGHVDRLVARAPGHATTVRGIESFPGVTLDVEIRLVAEARVEGVVTDRAGRPLAETNVSYGTHDDFDRCQSITDDAGRFSLRGLPAGELEIVATHREFFGDATTVTTVAGERSEWNPVLDSGDAIVGIVVDAESGIPVPRLTVGAALAVESTSWDRSGLTDRHGRFRILSLEDRAYVLQVHDFERFNGIPLAVVEGVEPGGPELRIPVTGAFLERGRIVGQVVDPDGLPVPDGAVAVVPLPERRPAQYARIHEGGSFALENVIPGSYELDVKNKELGFSPRTVDVRESETLDVGLLRLDRGGTVALRVVSSEAIDLEGLKVFLTRDGGWGSADFAFDGDTFRSEETPPGPAVIMVYGPDVATQTAPVDVQSGVETSVSITLRRGVPLRVVLGRSAPPSEGGTTTVSLESEGPGENLTQTFRSSDETIVLNFRVVPGTYRVSARDSDGAERSTEITVDEPDGGSVDLEL